MGEEWRRGWHPELIAPKTSGDTVLIVGAGPAGLECARALGQRGYDVHLAEATTELGGRVTLESRLPGLSEWARVRDYRVGQIEKMPNVTIYRDSRMGAAEIRESGFAHIVLASGSRWRRDGSGRSSFAPIPGSDEPQVFTPDDLLASRDIPGPVLVYDDDPYYMGGAVAEALRKRGQPVILVTPAALVSEWTVGSQEQPYIQARLIEGGVDIIVSHRLSAIRDGEAQLVCAFTERPHTIAARSVVIVSLRMPNDALYHELMSDNAALGETGIKSVTRIGDCLVPGTIAAAVHDGHRYAREFGAAPPADVPFKRERITLATL
jgi:dimethylamine/trimethylamine dehydrogenase